MKIKERKKANKNTITNINSLGEQRDDREERKENKLRDKEEERKRRILRIWDENKSCCIFNPLRKNIDFNKAKPTDYTINKHIHLPKPLPVEEEFQCKIRKKSYMKAFYTDKKEISNKFRDNGKKHSSSCKSRNNIERKEEKAEEASNLTKKEKMGL